MISRKYEASGYNNHYERPYMTSEQDATFEEIRHKYFSNGLSDGIRYGGGIDGRVFVYFDDNEFQIAQDGTILREPEWVKTESVQKEQSYISTQQQAVLKDLIVQAGGTLNVNIMGNSGDNRDILNVRVYDKDDSKKYRDLKINRYGTIMESSSIGFLSHTNYGKRDAYDKGFVAGYEGENWNYAGDYADDYEGGFKDGKVKRQSEINHHVLATESVKINEEVGEYSYWAIYFPNEGFGQTLYKAMPIDADEEDVLRQAIIDKEMEVSESNSVEVTRVDKAEYDNSVE